MSYNIDDMSILLVEDNAHDRKLLLDTLCKYFKKVYEAKDAEEALVFYKKYKTIDIIISNIGSSKINGLNLLKMIRMSDFYIPFIITTGKNNPELLIEAINLNVSSFLIKPVNTQKLLEKIDMFCEQTLLEKKLKSKQKEITNYLDAVDKVALIYKMKEDGSITHMNQTMREICGYNKQEVHHLNFNHIIHPDIPQKYLDATWEHIKAGEIWKGNTKFITKENQTFYLNNTIFKIDEDDEFITIAFLTTKENLEKRDFHKKVLVTLKEANKREHDLKNQLTTIATEANECKIQINSYAANLDKLKEKLASKESQLKSFEKEIAELNTKYNKMLLSKKEELEFHINLAQTQKMKLDKIEAELKSEQEKSALLTEKCKTLQEDVIQKNKILKDLTHIIKEKK